MLSKGLKGRDSKGAPDRKTNQQVPSAKRRGKPKQPQTNRTIPNQIKPNQPHHTKSNQTNQPHHTKANQTKPNRNSQGSPNKGKNKKKKQPTSHTKPKPPNQHPKPTPNQRPFLPLWRSKRSKGPRFRREDGWHSQGAAPGEFLQLPAVHEDGDHRGGADDDHASVCLILLAADMSLWAAIALLELLSFVCFDCSWGL